MPIVLSRRVAIISVSLCLLLGWAGGSAFADVAISAAPSLFEVSATPGGVGSQQITVTNAGSEPFAVSAEIAQYKGGEGNLSALSWLRVEPASFDLAPGQRQVVKVTIAIPQDATSGGRYAMVAFRTGAKAIDGSAVGVAAQVGVPFLITVKGSAPLARQPNLGGLIPVLESRDSLGFRAVVENGGSTHLYARGTVEVTGGDGKPWGRFDLRDSTAILPGTSELLHSDRPISFREGATYLGKATVFFGEGSPEIREFEFQATAALEIEDVTPTTSPTGDLDVRLRLKNTGGLGLIPRIMMAVRGDQGDVAGVLTPNRQPLIWPGQTVEVAARYPGRLAPGEYALVARAEFGAASAQQETPFEIANSGSPAGASIPVNEWAAAAPTQPLPAPQQIPEQSPQIQVAAHPVQEEGGLGLDVRTMLLPLAVVAAAGVAFVTHRRRPVPVAPRPRSPLALPSPRSLRSIFIERLGSHKRPYSAYRPAGMLPPPPLHLLPPPMETSDQDLRIPSAMAVAEMDPVERAPRYTPPSERTPGLDLAWMSSEMAAAHDLRRRLIMPKLEKRSRFASAIVEKAAILVGEAKKAAQIGDRAVVERSSRLALQLDARNTDAWLWLAASCVDPQSARMCLEAVQILDPSNVKAKRALETLDGGIIGDGRAEDPGEATRPGQGNSPGAFSQPAS